MLLIAAPGQGAQAAGFLAPWLEFPGFSDRLAAWSDLAGIDLVLAEARLAAAERARFGLSGGGHRVRSASMS